MADDQRPPLTVRLLRHELDSIPKYSCTLPTATTPGKMWLRVDGRMTLEMKLRETNPQGLWLGMYGEPDGDLVPVLWAHVEVLEGPAPRQYSPPDWSNYARWVAEREREAEHA